MWITADRNKVYQLEVLQIHSTIWAKAVEHSSLTKKEKQIAYSAFLRPQIAYPLGCTTIEDIELKRLFRPVLDILLHMLGFNKHFPLAMIHAGPANMGLDIDNFLTMQGIAQLQLLLRHINKRDWTGCLIESSSKHLELKIGLGTCPLASPHIVQYEHVSTTWVASVCNFLHRTNSWVEKCGSRVVQT